MQLGSICTYLDRHGEAKRYFQAAAQLAPTRTGAYVRLCEACLRLGEWNEAVRALNEAQALAPDDPQVIALAGRVERRKGQ